MYIHGELKNIQIDLQEYPHLCKTFTFELIEEFLSTGIDEKNQSSKNRIILNITYNNEINIYHSICTENNIITILIINNKSISTSSSKSKKTYKIECDNLATQNNTDNINNKFYKYKLAVVNNSLASINKKAKKDLLGIVNQINKNNTLFSYNKKLLLIIDNNGLVQYYPDSMEIYDNKTIGKYMNSCNLDSLETILAKNGYMNLECNLFGTAYNLNEIKIDQLLHQQSNSQIAIQDQNLNIISTIGSIFNWINPFSYYSGNSNNTNLIPTTDNNTSIIPNIQSSKTELIIKVFQYYNAKDSNTIIKKLKKEENRQNISNVDNVENIDYQIKVLKPEVLNYPIHINNITTDEFENIILDGTIPETDIKMHITFNKFLINPLVYVC